MSDEVEEWRTVPGWPFYEVSNIGRLRSSTKVVRCRFGTRKYPGRIKSLVFDSDGYLVTVLYDAPRRSNAKIHRLVLEAFVGPPPFDDAQTRHLDGVKTNNRVDNLAWGTAAENSQDQIAHGSSTAGSRNWMAVLDEGRVLEIIELLRDGRLTQREIAKRYGVSNMVISLIATGRSWKHIVRERLSFKVGRPRRC